MSESPWKIHKFGGSSLADASCFERVGDIVAAMTRDRVGVVVSAMGGMTNDLLRLATLAESQDDGWRQLLAEIGQRYADTAKALVGENELVELLDAWSADGREIEDLLQVIAAAKTASEHSRNVIAGYGELWSARLLASYLGGRLGADRAGTWVDAREVIFVRHSDLGPSVLWDESRQRIRNVLPADFSGVAVMTGFIAVDENGVQTTLGRNGSDFSAAIFAALTDADELDIWTDVDGVMSADPNRVPDAHIINALSYDEAMELAYFGAKVIHPQTMGPAVDNGIAVVIRNSFNPEHPGSRIGTVADEDGRIKGITTVGEMALVNLEGAGMIGVPGTADRLFAALKDAGVSVTLISQASSEHSICIAVPAERAERARDVISEAFADELSGGQIQRVDVKPGQSIIAVVGDGMAGTPGVAARFFSSLGRAGINIRAIAQGSSERNISAVIDSDDATRALRAVHSGFYLSATTISVGVIGTGVVGATFIDQIAQQTERLRARFNVDIRVRGIARSKRMLLGERRVELDNWRDELAGSSQQTDFEEFVAHVAADHLPHAVIVDCTADDGLAASYPAWLAQGIHVITPNKKAFSGDLELYRSLATSAQEGGSHYLYETTVGAALPITKTVRDLVDTGDRIHSVKGILSGTLAYLFNVYDGSVPFSSIVADARANGFTEPDPRDDLSGMDVARKLTIIARELGMDLSIGDFPVENLIPESLRDISADEFMTGLAAYDDDMLERYKRATEAGMTLRYIASLDATGNASVALCEVPEDDSFSNMQLTDNLVQFASDRYSNNPLVIQGPGAGPAVTAGGVFGDLLTLARMLGNGS